MFLFGAKSRFSRTWKIEKKKKKGFFGFLGVMFASLSSGRCGLAEVGLLGGVAGLRVCVGIVQIEKFVSLESEIMKERMKKWRLCVEEKMKNEEMRRIERKKERKESQRRRELLGASWHDMTRQICGSHKWNEITILPL